MISKLIIKNFQSHPNSSLEFEKGVNIIVGSSDSGKSAIIRALNWVINNRPSGDSFISFWSDEATAAITTDCRNKVTRRKGKGLNNYSINDDVLSAMGQEIPERVKKILKFSELNIQHQLDSPFLLSASAGEVSRFFNRVAKLDSIDSALTSISSKKREVEHTLKTAEERLIHTEKLLLEFSDLDSIKKLVDKAEAIHTHFKTKMQIYSKVNSALKNLQAAKSISESYTDIMNAAPLIEKGSELYSQMMSTKELHAKIKSALTNITALNKSLQDENEKLLIIEIDFHNEFPEGVCPLCGQQMPY